MPDLRVSFPKPCDEAWEAMTPSGCDRVCARCDHVVHDLREYTFDEAEALMRANPNSCVRALIGSDGAVALKAGRGGSKRRMVIAAAATASLLAGAPAYAREGRPSGAISGAGAPAYAREGRPSGAISGRVVFCTDYSTRAVATGADGRRFRARVHSDGRFRLKHLPAGTYTLTFETHGRQDQVLENVLVRDGETSSPNLDDGSQCVVIGLLSVENDRA
jgi:hypothetical protein